MSNSQKNPEDALNFLLVEDCHMREQFGLFHGRAWRIGPFVHSMRHRSHELASLIEIVQGLVIAGEGKYDGHVDRGKIPQICTDLFNTREKQTIKMTRNDANDHWDEDPEKIKPLLDLQWHQSFQKKATDAVIRLYEEDVGTEGEKPRREGDYSGLTLYVVSDRIVPRPYLPDGESPEERLCGPRTTSWGYGDYNEELDTMTREEQRLPPPQPKSRYADWDCKNLPYDGDLAIFLTWEEAETHVKGLHTNKLHGFRHITDTKDREKFVPDEIQVYEMQTEEPGSTVLQMRLITIHNIHFGTGTNDRVDITML